MPLNSKQFGELFTYTRASGATRVNAAGRIVGVDFSSTSNDVGTGAKTFTLTAGLSVNRDWVAGSAVRAVDQVGGAAMIGTVTSYTPSTQALVINVASITGSGTGRTNWRIGSLEFRRDFDPVTLVPKGGLVEGGATNLLINSENQTGAGYNRNSITVSAASGVFLNGNNTFHKVIYGNGILPGESTGSGLVPVFTQVAGTTYAVSFYAKAAEQTALRIRDNTLGGLAVVNLVTGAVSVTGASFIQLSATSVGSGVYRISWIFTSTSTSTGVGYSVRADVTGDGASGFLVAGFQAEVGSAPSSYIPTTTVAVTRAADLLSIGGTNFNQFYNSSQGTLVMEMTPIAQAVGAVAGSLNDGTVNNAIRIQQKQSGTLSSIRKMATDGVTDVMAVNAVNETLVSNGIDYRVTPTLNVGTFGAATSGADQFLTVGQFEVFQNLTNKATQRTGRGIGGTFVGAHFGIGRFVIPNSAALDNGAAVGSVIVSTDGLAFRRVNIPGLTQNLNDITSNGTNQYVAVGNGGVIYTSPDSETWTAQTSGTTSQLNGVHHFGGRYVAVGTSASHYSDNGTTWTTTTGLAMVALDVHHNGTNLWVAVGGASNSQRIYTSSDGITWSLAFSGAANSTDLYGVHFADGLWVAVGGNGGIVTSADGTTWTVRTANSGTTETIFEVNFFNGKFYYAGTGQVIGENTAANIVANVTWTARTANVTATLIGIATNGSRLLICGTAGAITTSDDGTTFTSRTGNAATLNGAAFGNGTYVVVGNAINGSGLIATVNPTTFEYQRRVSGTTLAVSGVKFLNGAFYAPRLQAIIRSTDGITWDNRPVGGTDTTFTDVAFGASIYVAISLGAAYSVSSDGVTWGDHTNVGVTAQQLNGIDFANGLFVAVGAAGAIITSPNGTTWTLRTSGTTVNLFSVMYSTRDSMWYAAGDNGVILRSADAITWTSIANDAVGAVIAGGTVQSSPALPDLIIGQPNKVAMRIKANDFGVSVNGADAVTDVSGGLPGAVQLSVGMNGVNGQHFNAHIRKMTYYPLAKTDQELKELST